MFGPLEPLHGTVASKRPGMRRSELRGQHMNERVTLVRDGAVAFIEICRSERHNALDVETARAFLERCREVDGDDTVRAVVR